MTWNKLTSPSIVVSCFLKITLSKMLISWLYKIWFSSPMLNPPNMTSTQWHCKTGFNFSFSTWTQHNVVCEPKCYQNEFISRAADCNSVHMTRFCITPWHTLEADTTKSHYVKADGINERVGIAFLFWEFHKPRRLTWFNERSKATMQTFYICITIHRMRFHWHPHCDNPHNLGESCFLIPVMIGKVPAWTLDFYEKNCS